MEEKKNKSLLFADRMITNLKKFNEQTARSNKDVQVSCIRVQPKKN